MSRISKPLTLSLLSMIAIACGETSQSEVPPPARPSGVEISARTAEEFLRSAGNGWHQLGEEDFVKEEGGLRTRVRFGQAALLGALEEAKQRRDELIHHRNSDSTTSATFAEVEQQIASLTSLLKGEVQVNSLDYKEGRTCSSSWYKVQSLSNGDSSGCYAAASAFYDSVVGPRPGYYAASSTACVDTPSYRNCNTVGSTGSVSDYHAKQSGVSCHATAAAMLYDSCGSILLTTEAWGY